MMKAVLLQSKNNLHFIFHFRKLDYIKLFVKDDKVEVIYGNGLDSRMKGKSPITRPFNLNLKGDSCDDLIT